MAFYCLKKICKSNRTCGKLIQCKGKPKLFSLFAYSMCQCQNLAAESSRRSKRNPIKEAITDQQEPVLYYDTNKTKSSEKSK